MILALLLLAAPAGAADLPGWDGTHWGMTSAELLRQFGKRATHLATRLDFGPFYSDVVLRRERFAGLDITVYFQMDRADGRLAQVLLERRRQGATPAGWQAVLDELHQALGPPTARCPGREDAGRLGPEMPEEVWVTPTTTVHASFIDVALPMINQRLDVMQRLLVRYAPTRPGAAACP